MKDTHVNLSELFFNRVVESQIKFDRVLDFSYITRYMATCQAMANHLNFRQVENISILDVGCSSGTLYGFMTRNTQMFSNVCIHFTGIDVRDSAVKLAQEKYPEQKFLTLDLDQNALRDAVTGKFDVINAQQFIEHISVDAGDTFLNDAYNLLQDDGLLILSSPNPKKEKGEMVVHEMSKDHHEFEYSFAEMKEKLERAGFDIALCKGSMPTYKGDFVSAFDEEDRSLLERFKWISWSLPLTLIGHEDLQKCISYFIIARKISKERS